MENENRYDVVVVGSGPAGLTAAIYSVRAALATVVVSGGQPGGQLIITTLVENFPGFSKAIGGVKLMMDMQEQVKNLGGEIVSDKVISVSKNEELFEVKLKSGKIIQARAVIVATGAKARWLGLPREKEMVGKGVSGCATCDGPFFKDKVVAVVGGGDTAVTEAVFLTKFAKKVYLLHRRDKLRASKKEQERLFKSGVEIKWNSEVKEIVGEEKLEKIKVVNNKSGKEETMILDGLFVAIGADPATEFLKGAVAMKESGHIVVGKNLTLPTMTSVEGLFAAGDCVDGIYKQAVMAAGDGCKAAMDAEKWLR